jgi:microsomal dipeptidase-like Zn-dependent dipeptidase
VVSKPKSNDTTSPHRPPATTPEGRESQLIAAAVALAEKQLLEGTATSQVITHYLKLGSSREQLEQQRIRYENELLQAKSKAIDAQEEMAQLASNAIKAMRSYQGAPPLEQEQEFDL